MEISGIRYPIGVQSFEDLRKDGYVSPSSLTGR